MKIHLFISLTTSKDQGKYQAMMKTFESDIRPVKGDIIDDPGFDPKFHNGYEVVKVTINYTSDECYASLCPLAMEVEEIRLEAYIKKLQANGWCAVSKGELESR